MEHIELNNLVRISVKCAHNICAAILFFHSRDVSCNYLFLYFTIVFYFSELDTSLIILEPSSIYCISIHTAKLIAFCIFPCFCHSHD